jgi:hypothetical protein
MKWLPLSAAVIDSPGRAVTIVTHSISSARAGGRRSVAVEDHSHADGD